MARCAPCREDGPIGTQDGRRHRAQTRGEWAARGACLILGSLVAAGLLFFLHQRRVDAAEIALGEDTASVVIEYRGEILNAHRLEHYAEAWPASGNRDAVLWLGNSQMHAINQYRDGQKLAPFYASEVLSRPIRCLSIPNANLQEHLVVLRWAIARNKPKRLVLPLVYDDLREDELRPGFSELRGDDLIASLRGSELGDRLSDQLALIGTDVGDALDASDSMQQRVENALEQGLSDRWVVWRERDKTLGALNNVLYRLRNAALGIKPTSKRKMIPVRYERNMQALDAILSLAAEHRIETLVYVVPLRWDIEPPYVLDAYRDWKQAAAGLVAEHGARFVDLDRLVPDEVWGSYGAGDNIDFMHFQEPGHRLLGSEIARLLSERAPAGG